MESLRQDGGELAFSDEIPFQMARDLVLVELDAPKEGIIWVPPDKDTTSGTVIKVGRNPTLRKKTDQEWGFVEETGIAVEHDINAGDRVLIAGAMGMKVTWNGKPAVMLHEDEVLGVLEECAG